MPRLSTHIDITRPVSVVFSILREVKAYPDHFHYVRSISVLSITSDSLTAEIREELYGVRQSVLAHFQFMPPSRIIVEQIQGPFASATAEFRLEPNNNQGTRLHHTIQFEVKSGFGGALLRRAIAGSLVETRMNEEITAIKRAAEKMPQFGAYANQEPTTSQD